MVTKGQIAQLKKTLLKRQNELIKQVQDHYGFEFAFLKETKDELSSYDNHPGEHGTALFEREKDLALNEHAEEELKDINSALHAIDEGTYGICVKCGRDIPFERLEAIPTTDVCMKHALNHRIDDDNRPVEEDVFSPNINPDPDARYRQNAYDAEDSWQDVSRYGNSNTPSDIYGDQDNYNEVYANSGENRGSVEDIEGFIAADIDGHFTGVTPNHNKYEKQLDNEESD